MSKSVGNVVDPLQLVATHGADYVRYFLAAEFHFGNDGDFSHAQFVNRINGDLANNLGNLVMRVLCLVERHCGGKVPEPSELSIEDHCILHSARGLVGTMRTHVQEQSMKDMCDAVLQMGRVANKYVVTEEPWALAKSDPDRLNTVLYVLMELLRCCAVSLEPVMPATCVRMQDQLGLPDELRTFDSLSRVPLPAGLAIGKVEPLFPKIEHKNDVPCAWRQREPEAAPKKAKKADHELCEAVLLQLSDKYLGLCDNELQSKLTEVGSVIRSMKLSKAQREDLKPFLNELNYLKIR